MKIIAFSALAALLFHPFHTFADEHSQHAGHSNHHADKKQNTVDASIHLEKPFHKGYSLTTKLTLKDQSTKKALTLDDLKEAHTKKIHVLIFDKSLEDYQHVHPEPTDKPGDYQFSWQPKKRGPYRFWIDIVPVKTDVQEFIKVDLHQRHVSKRVKAIKTLSMQSTVEGLTYKLSFDQSTLKAGKAVMGTIEITQQDGKPFKQLEPIMGTFAHIVALYEDFKTLEHIHPMGAENPKPEERGGPKLEFHMNVSKPGFLKIYVQVKIDGKEQFVPFGVQIN